MNMISGNRKFVGRATAAFLASAAVAGAAFTPPASAKSCRFGYTSAGIGGAQKCLHAGEYCAHAEAGQYRRYHFKCVAVNGTYRLERS